VTDKCDHSMREATLPKIFEGSGGIFRKCAWVGAIPPVGRLRNLAKIYTGGCCGWKAISHSTIDPIVLCLQRQTHKNTVKLTELRVTIDV